jgi:hypothetical protein
LEVGKMRKPAFIEMGKTPWMMRRGLDFLEMGFVLSKIPYINRLHPWTKPEKTDMRWLPINEDIQMPQDVPLPVNLLYRFIEEASYRTIYKECACRKGFECKHYPTDIGCLLMGNSALEGPPGLYEEASVEEAKQLADRAIEAGLVPVVGKARVDNFIFGIKDTGHLLRVLLYHPLHPSYSLRYYGASFPAPGRHHRGGHRGMRGMRQVCRSLLHKGHRGSG